MRYAKGVLQIMDTRNAIQKRAAEVAQLRPGDWRHGDRFHDDVVQDVRFARGGVEVTLQRPDGTVHTVLMSGRRAYPITRAAGR